MVYSLLTFIILKLICGRGDYEPKSELRHKAITYDGENWELISENQGFGYASCVQYVPHSNGKSLVSVGRRTLLLNDGGYSWNNWLFSMDLLQHSFVDKRTAIAAGKIKL
jgi:hypothetical protein